jgi:murein L,D-transpeptidase YcbB/YkuD
VTDQPATGLEQFRTETPEHTAVARRRAARRRRQRTTVACLFGAIAIFLIFFFARPKASVLATIPASSNRGESVGRDSLAIGAALARALDAPRPSFLRNDEWATVRRLYERTTPSASAAALWVQGNGLASRAAAFSLLLDSVETVGLRPADYAAAALESALVSSDSLRGSSAGDMALARADVLLTSSFVSLTDDLLTGRVDPREVEPSWHITPRAFDVAARIASALDSIRAGRPVREVLDGLRPDYGSYGALIGGLARYRQIARAGAWPVVPNVATLRPGAASPAVAVLRRRLAAEGFLASAAGSDTLDAMTTAAIADFQRKHGLDVDSVVGPRTRRALNVPVDRRVRQIEANLERLRWLPPAPGERFIVVNVPAFTLYAFDGTERVLDMRVVVGDELVSRRTPIFADTLEYIEFGPYWNVPRSIAVNEILPKVRRDRGYLARNNYQLVRGSSDNAQVVDARRLSDAALFSSAYRVRQLPGPDNALGRVKFMFPNDYAVYLHDTPSKALFDETHRAHSHGCVRVADPEALAVFALRGRADWPRDRVAKTMAGTSRLRVTLQHGPPVFLIYLTAFGRDGEVVFRDDIYDRDDGLVRALARHTH